ncbi:MAG: hypothetical protein ACYC7E_17965 [Armatimonadota bacterium]
MREKFTQMLLLVVALLLLANLVATFAKPTEARAQAAKKCVGVSTTISDDKNNLYIVRAWDDGSVEMKAISSSLYGFRW